MMPLAPSFSYTMAVVLDGPRPGIYLKLFHTETLAAKDFFLAGHTNMAPIARHMESLTEDQCLSFVTVKVAKKKEKKVDAG
jgi:hypothetical protein